MPSDKILDQFRPRKREGFPGVSMVEHTRYRLSSLAGLGFCLTVATGCAVSGSAQFSTKFQEDNGVEMLEKKAEAEAEDSEFPDELMGEVLVWELFPFNVKLNQEGNETPSSVDVYMVPKPDRDSINQCKLHFFVKNAKGEVVFKADKSYDYLSQGDFTRFGVPELPVGEYEIEVTSLINYRSPESDAEVNENFRTLSFSVK